MQERIVEKFGENTLDIIDETPEELIKVPGIGKVRAERIKTSWKDQKEIKNIMLFPSKPTKSALPMLPRSIKPMEVKAFPL